MANTQINIGANGKTTLATAGKYCDRNIDVNVNVPQKATQFTNLYDPANVVIDKNAGYSSSGGYVVTADNETNYIRIPYKHAANEPIALRMRGIGTVRSRFAFQLWKNDGEIATWGQLSSIPKSYDEYGDVVFNFEEGSVFVRNAWNILELNFQYDGYNSVTEALTGPIITINEPIGNGGYAE